MQHPDMFIIVKYADNQSLVCNPMCSVVNLLSSIKSRTGHGDKDMLIDLSDETGETSLGHRKQTKGVS